MFITNVDMSMLTCSLSLRVSFNPLWLDEHLAGCRPSSEHGSLALPIEITLWIIINNYLIIVNE